MLKLIRNEKFLDLFSWSVMKTYICFSEFFSSKISFVNIFNYILVCFFLLRSYNNSSVSTLENQYLLFFSISLQTDCIFSSVHKWFSWLVGQLSHKNLEKKIKIKLKLNKVSFVNLVFKYLSQHFCNTILSFNKHFSCKFLLIGKITEKLNNAVIAIYGKPLRVISFKVFICF